MYYIFDLDNTVIDSSHRQTFVDGKLDLDAWKRGASALPSAGKVNREFIILRNAFTMPETIDNEFWPG